jgi:hypothetical protein
MRISLFFIFFLLSGAFCTAQELTGADHTSPGTLSSFEIIPAQGASWHVVTPSANTEPYQIDTGLSKLYFASPERGRFTIVAGIVTGGTPRLLIKTFHNGEKEAQPLPAPPVSSLESWVKTQTPILVKSQNLALESRLIADCFEQIVQRIDEGNIKTVQNARAQLQISLTGTLALASPTAVTDWTPFLSELSRRLEQELGEKIGDLSEVNKILQEVGSALKSLELPAGNAAPLRKNINPNNRRTPNRSFRNLLAP